MKEIFNAVEYGIYQNQIVINLSNWHLISIIFVTPMAIINKLLAKF